MTFYDKCNCEDHRTEVRNYCYEHNSVRYTYSGASCPIPSNYYCDKGPRGVKNESGRKSHSS